jgi:hypothetical protein
MKYVSILASAVCALALGGVSAQAAMVKLPSHSASPVTAPGAKGIVGTWLTAYNGGVHSAFTQWHKDRTTAQIVDQVPKTGVNIQLGDWKSSDDGSYSLYLIGWTYDDKGQNLTGTFTKTETDTLSGDSYSGTFEVTFYDLSGNILFQQDGTLTATRVD